MAKCDILFISVLKQYYRKAVTLTGITTKNTTTGYIDK